MNKTELTPAEIVRRAVRASSQQRSLSGDERKHVAKASRYNILVQIKGDRVLAYNSMSGALAVWDDDDLKTYDRILGGELVLGAQEVGPFLNGGYAVGEGEDELAVLRGRYEARRFDPNSMVMTIAPTLGCNFACAYCFQGADKPFNKISEDVKDAVYTFLEEKTRSLNNLHVAWYGGEPLMERKTVIEMSDRIMEICRRTKTNYSAFVVTNGYFLDADLAKELYARKVTTCQVTFDGPPDFHDQRRHLLSGKPTFDRIAENLIEVVRTVPMHVSIRVNIDSSNKDQVKALIDTLVDRGFANRGNFGIYFAPVEAITNECHSCHHGSMTKSDYGQLEAELNRYAVDRGLSALPRPPLFFGNCQAVRPNGVLVSPNGDLHKCWDTVMNNELRIGSIFDVEAAFQSSRQQQWLDWTPFDNEVCGNCRILPSCMGACAYKFIHADRTMGEAAQLPCPSWKFNIAERLFLRAEKRGAVTREDWMEGASSTSVDITGERHSATSVEKASENFRQNADDQLPV